MSKRHCLGLDLHDDSRVIEEYVRYHADVWPEVKQSLRDSGILDMEIYLIGNRLFMIIEAEDSFSFERKNAMDAANPKVQEWEALMGAFQKTLPQSTPDQKWVEGKRVFKLAE